jgi:hypothetical protein
MSKLEKIQPIEVKPAKAVSAKTLEKQELLRRRIVAKHIINGDSFVQAPFVKSIDKLTGETVWSPNLPAGIKFEHRWQDQDRPVWCVPSAQAVGLSKACDVARLDMGDLDDPKEQEKLRKALAAGEHEMQKILWESGLSFGDVDLHLKPIAAKASGLQSPLHTAVKFTDLFDTAYDPLHDSPNWTGLTHGAYIYSTGEPTNRAYNKAAGGTNRFVRLSANGYAPMDENYSVEAVTLDYASGSAIVVPTVISRIVDSGNFYYSICNPTQSAESIRVRIGDSPATLASQAYSTTGAHKVRQQITGTGDDITIVYFRDGAEIFSATGLHEDYQLNGKGTAGLFVYIHANVSPGDVSYYEAFKCYEAAGARGPFRTGPFREGPFKRGAFR